MHNGWIKTYRDLLDHWIMKDAMEYRAWSRLLLLVNWKSCTGVFQGRECEVPPGAMMTSYEHLSRVLMVSTKQARTYVKRWQDRDMITYETWRNGAKLTVCNFTAYQGEGHTEGTQRASEGHAEGNILRRKKEEEKNTSKSKRQRTAFVAPSLDECKGYAADIQMRQSQAEEFHDFYESKGWMVGRSPMKDWQAAMRRWKRTSPPLPATVIAYFQQHPAYLGQPEIAALAAEHFGKHYEGQEWKTGSGQRITDFTKKADQWIANNRSQQ
jgi:hypothetical protein